jgi:hypothetical protein
MYSVSAGNGRFYAEIIGRIKKVEESKKGCTDGKKA